MVHFNLYFFFQTPLKKDQGICLERAIEDLQLAITSSEQNLAELKAQYALERAAEAVVMVNEGEEELANQATSEYVEMLAAATEHLNKAIEAKDEAVQTLETLNEAYKNSEELLTTVLEKTPEDTQVALEAVLVEQDKALTAGQGRAKSL